MHMTMFGAWDGGEGGQQGCPILEGGPRLIWFESPRWRPKATQVHFQEGEHCWLLPMSARPSIPTLSLVSSNLLQDSVDIHRVHSDHGVYMLPEICMRDDMLETWKHGHVPSHNYFSFLCPRNPVLLYVVQDQF